MVRLPLSGSGILPTSVMNQPDVGDGFLLSRGWTIAVPGWQWDVPREAGFAGLSAPVADVGPGWMRGDLRIDVPSTERSIRDTLPVQGGGRPAHRLRRLPGHRPGPAGRAAAGAAAQMGPSRLIPRSQWRFTSPTSITLDGGFQQFHWYELIYQSEFAPVGRRGPARPAGLRRVPARSVRLRLRRRDLAVRPGCCVSSCSRDSTPMRRAGRSSTGCSPRSPVPGAVSSTAGTPSPACCTR